MTPRSRLWYELVGPGCWRNRCGETPAVRRRSEGLGLPVAALELRVLRHVFRARVSAQEAEAVIFECERHGYVLVSRGDSCPGCLAEILRFDVRDDAKRRADRLVSLYRRVTNSRALSLQGES